MSYWKLQFLNRLGVALALMFSVPALAANWVFVTTDKDGNKHYQEMSSVKRTGNLVTVWEKELIAKIKPDGVTHTVVRVRYDCDAQTQVLLEMVTYNKTGTAVKSYSWDKYGQTEDAIIPGTLGSDTFDAICVKN